MFSAEGGDISKFLVSTVPADGLVIIAVRTSTGIVITTLKSHIYRKLPSVGLHHLVQTDPFITRSLFPKMFTHSDLLHNSQTAQVPCPTMRHLLREICTCVHISVKKRRIVGYLSNALWDMWDGCIDDILRQGTMYPTIYRYKINRCTLLSFVFK